MLTPHNGENTMNTDAGTQSEYGNRNQQAPTKSCKAPWILVLILLIAGVCGYFYIRAVSAECQAKVAEAEKRKVEAESKLENAVLRAEAGCAPIREREKNCQLELTRVQNAARELSKAKDVLNRSYSE